MALWHFLLLVFISLSRGDARVITLKNRCNTTIWPGFRATTFVSSHSEEWAGGFELKPGASANLQTPVIWIGYIWARYGCSFNPSGHGFCFSGDCGGELACSKENSPVEPATFARLNMNDITGDDTYKLDVINGFNLPISIVPNGPDSSLCETIECVPQDLSNTCPRELQVRNEGHIVACRSGCLAFHKPELCCIGEYANKRVCNHTKYSIAFKNTCPIADTHPNERFVYTVCDTSPNYLIIFC
ncbi:pathogenesis-related thaumatin-like protein 3.5 [Hevea brasiliensis]|uniref:pathogenesis-related thaumatin-like protein 3.5 n=1 Tax=Hevea brasiliensis TaxID=3981 RepID=UPI0025D1AEF7|nr:pathogenesis-related thaumatin-like protein 3.5 [Hevea brasiliensis]